MSISRIDIEFQGIDHPEGSLERHIIDASKSGSYVRHIIIMGQPYSICRAECNNSPLADKNMFSASLSRLSLMKIPRDFFNKMEQVMVEKNRSDAVEELYL